MTTMFMSDPMLKTSLVIEATNNILHGRDVAMSIQRILLVAAWGVVTQIISNGYRELFMDDDKDFFDPKEWALAAATAPLQGLFLVGTVAESILAAASGVKVHRGGQPLPLEAWDRAERVIKHYDKLWDTHDPLTMTKTWDDILKAASVVHPGVAALSALTNIAKPIVGAATIHND
jgi:hypothetical protein